MIVKETSNYLRLKENLEYLKLKQFSLHLDELIAERNTSLVEALLKLTDYEVVKVNRKMVHSYSPKVVHI